MKLGDMWGIKTKGQYQKEKIMIIFLELMMKKNKPRKVITT